MPGDRVFPLPWAYALDSGTQDPCILDYVLLVVAPGDQVFPLTWAGPLDLGSLWPATLNPWDPPGELPRSLQPAASSQQPAASS